MCKHIQDLSCRRTTTSCHMLRPATAAGTVLVQSTHCIGKCLANLVKQVKLIKPVDRPSPLTKPIYTMWPSCRGLFVLNEQNSHQPEDKLTKRQRLPTSRKGDNGNLEFDRVEMGGARLHVWPGRGPYAAKYPKNQTNQTHQAHQTKLSSRDRPWHAPWGEWL